MENLAQRAALLRESLQKSQSATDVVVSILGSFDSRLSALDAAMRPIQVRMHVVRTFHENIDRTLRSADVILTWFDRTREAEREIQKGPHENLQAFLDAVDQLRSIERFFSSNRSYRSSDGVLSHVNALLSKALVKIKANIWSLIVFLIAFQVRFDHHLNLSPKVEKTHQLVLIPNISKTQRLLYTILLLLLSQSLFLCSLN